MVVRFATCHALPDKDVEVWLREVAAEVRGVEGMRRVEFVRSSTDPNQYGSIMVFKTEEDLAEYKSAGPYERLVKSMRASWLDGSTPVVEQVYEVLDI